VNPLKANEPHRFPLGFPGAALLLFVSIFLSVAARAQVEDVEKSSQVVAAFVYQFTNYITWPDESPPSETKPFAISIVGKETKIFKHLEALAKIKKVHKRPIEVILTEVPLLAKSQIVIVDSREGTLLQEVLRKVKGQNTLVISQGNGFAKKGSMINFYVEESRVRFEINQSAAKKENLQIGSQLLNLAKLVSE
jgi:hypothetical protein